MNGRGDLARAALTGCGLALAFGWVWFGALSSFWLPGVLWGTLSSGGGASLFYALLMIGFLGAGQLAGRLQAQDLEPAASFHRLAVSAGPHLVHGLGYLALDLGFYWRAIVGAAPPAPTPWPYVPVILTAGAALMTGLFWGARLLALPRSTVGRAYLFAAGTAVLLALLADLASPAMRRAMAQQGVLVAWALCLALIWLDKARPKGRGRPRIERGEPGSTPAARFPAAFFLAVLALLGLEATLTPAETAVPAPWLATLLNLAGAVVSLGAVGLLKRPDESDEPGDQPPVLRSLGPALTALAGFGLIRLLTPSGWPWLDPLVEGIIVAAAVTMLAETPPKEAWRRAGRALGLTALAVTAGSALGQFAATPWNHELNVRLAGGAALAVAGAAWLFYRRSERMTGEKADPAFALTALTPKECEIALLVGQGRTNREIGLALDIGDPTVRFHLRNIYQKTGLTKRAELANAVAAPAQPTAKPPRSNG